MFRSTAIYLRRVNSYKIKQQTFHAGPGDHQTLLRITESFRRLDHVLAWVEVEGMWSMNVIYLGKLKRPHCDLTGNHG